MFKTIVEYENRSETADMPYLTPCRFPFSFHCVGIYERDEIRLMVFRDFDYAYWLWIRRGACRVANSIIFQGEFAFNAQVIDYVLDSCPFKI